MSDDMNTGIDHKTRELLQSVRSDMGMEWIQCCVMLYGDKAISPRFTIFAGRRGAHMLHVEATTLDGALSALRIAHQKK